MMCTQLEAPQDLVIGSTEGITDILEWSASDGWVAVEGPLSLAADGRSRWHKPRVRDPRPGDRCVYVPLDYGRGGPPRLLPPDRTTLPNGLWIVREPSGTYRTDPRTGSVSCTTCTHLLLAERTGVEPFPYVPPSGRRADLPRWRVLATVGDLGRGGFPRAVQMLSQLARTLRPIVVQQATTIVAGPDRVGETGTMETRLHTAPDGTVTLSYHYTTNRGS